MRVRDGEGVRASVVACVCLLVCIESICMKDCVILHFILAIFENMPIMRNQRRDKKTTLL